METMKKIIWIDDSYNGMENIARGIYRDLWEKGIINHVTFLGDSDIHGTDNGIILFREFVAAYFYDILELFESGSPDEPTFEADIKQYIENDIKNLDTLGIELLKEAKNASEIEKTLSAWKSPINREHWVTENKESPPIELSMELKADTLIEALTNDDISPENTVFALDLVLLENDEQRLNCEYDKSHPIISMEIYHQLKNMKFKCFLYTQYTPQLRIRNNWVKLYEERYSEPIGKIYPRDGLYLGTINADTIRDIISLCK